MAGCCRLYQQLAESYKKKKKSHVEGFYTSSRFAGLVYDHLLNQRCDFLSQVSSQLCSHSWLKEKGAARGRVGVDSAVCGLCGGAAPARWEMSSAEVELRVRDRGELSTSSPDRPSSRDKTKRRPHVANIPAIRSHTQSSVYSRPLQIRLFRCSITHTHPALPCLVNETFKDKLFY